MKIPWFKAWSIFSLIYLFLRVGNILPGFEEPKLWKYFQATCMETPYLEGYESQVEVRINSESPRLSSAVSAPPLFQRLLSVVATSGQLRADKRCWFQCFSKVSPKVGLSWSCYQDNWGLLYIGTSSELETGCRNCFTWPKTSYSPFNYQKLGLV